METIKIHRTAFIGPNAIGQANRIISKIESLEGEWYMALVSKGHNEAIELFMIEDGEIVDASYHRGKDLQEAVTFTKRIERNFIELELA